MAERGLRVESKYLGGLFSLGGSCWLSGLTDQV